MRDWLEEDLGRHRSGRYALGDAKDLNELEAGSIVFFHKGNWVVGYAVVELPLRAMTDIESRLSDEFWRKNGKGVIKLIPESIVGLRDDQFLPLEEVANAVGLDLDTLRRRHVVLAKDSDVIRGLKIFELIAQRPKLARTESPARSSGNPPP